MNIHVYLNVPGSILVMVIIWIDIYLIAYKSSRTEDRMILRKIILETSSRAFCAE